MNYTSKQPWTTTSTENDEPFVRCLRCGIIVASGNNLHRCRDGTLRDSYGRMPQQIQIPAQQIQIPTPKQSSRNVITKGLAAFFSVFLCFPIMLICLALVGLTGNFVWWFPGFFVGIIGTLLFWHATSAPTM
jgi:hypothetical protein